MQRRSKKKSKQIRRCAADRFRRIQCHDMSGQGCRSCLGARPDYTESEHVGCNVRLLLECWVFLAKLAREHVLQMEISPVKEWEPVVLHPDKQRLQMLLQHALELRNLRRECLCRMENKWRCSADPLYGCFFEQRLVYKSMKTRAESQPLREHLSYEPLH